jgi:hypothetical protein
MVTLICTPLDVVIDVALSAQRVHAQGEENLIEVIKSHGRYYIGTADRDGYTLPQVAESAVPTDYEPGKYLYSPEGWELNPAYTPPVPRSL